MKYPNLKENQVSVVVAKKETGHVLNVLGEVSNVERDEIYHIFNSQNDAYNFIRKRILEDDTLEFGIYDKDQNVIHHILNDEAKKLSNEI